MKRIVDNAIKSISSQDINIKKNYKIFRILQKIINPSILNRKDYEDMDLLIDERKIRIRVFNPFEDSKKRKVIIFIHGGGWTIGSIDSYTKTCAELANETNRIVISIDYRLAPENPYPDGFNDCYDVINLIMNNLSNIGLKHKDICLMGDSAGGNLVAAISLKSRKTKDFKIKEQILLYPALQTDYSNTTRYKSVVENGKDYLLTQKSLQDYISLYVQNSSDLDNPYVAPLKAKILFNQPRTLIITANNDPLRDEGKSYARKLKLYLNDVTYYNYDGAMHGFINQFISKKYKKDAYDKIRGFLGDEHG